MTNVRNILNKAGDFLGVNPKTGWRNLKGLSWYYKDYKRFKKALGSSSEFPFAKPFPILIEKDMESGNSSGHYFHQDLLVAQKIFVNNPVKHVDIGSRLDGFVAHVASFREIEVFDIRPLSSVHDNIVFRKVDFMRVGDDLLDFADSVSCLHVIEHFGLGRYGDAIDPVGHLKGLDNIYKVIKKGGKFYFSTPIGPQRINFNAHRVFSVSYLLDLFKNKYKIDSFSYVNDLGNLVKDADLSSPEAKANFGCEFGCGIFEMTKI